MVLLVTTSPLTDLGRDKLQKTLTVPIASGQPRVPEYDSSSSTASGKGTGLEPPNETTSEGVGVEDHEDETNGDPFNCRDPTTRPRGPRDPHHTRRRPSGRH